MKFNRQRFCLAWLIIMIAMPICSATIQSMGEVKLNECITLQQICATCTFNTLSSIVYPNKSNVDLEPLNMTRSGTDYSWAFCNNTQLGTYLVNGYGDLGGVVTVWSYEYDATSLGDELTTAKSILYIFFLIAGIGLLLLTFYGAIAIPYKNPRNNDGYIISVNDLKYLKIFCIAMIYIELLFLFGIARGVTANYIPEIGINGFFDWAYSLMLSFMYPIIVCSLLFALVIFLQDKKLEKALSRGFDVE